MAFLIFLIRYDRSLRINIRYELRIAILGVQLYIPQKAEINSKNYGAITAQCNGKFGLVF